MSSWRPRTHNMFPRGNHAVQVIGPMLPRGPKKQKPAADADADVTNLPRLPPDVLAGVFLCLPASDLRRFRRVCKEWRDVISHLSFIHAHMVHGSRAPTHTIVFYPGRNRAYGVEAPLNGRGFLFDEQWRLTARFAVNGPADMIGTCNGLLCFRDSPHRVIRIVEPFTGESIALPLPPAAKARTCSTAGYHFGFDATARRYKIVCGLFEEGVDYDGYFFCPTSNAAMSSTTEQELHVFTVGADRDWRTVRVGRARHGVLYGDPACHDGGVYWYSQGVGEFCGYRCARFDLAKENITSKRRRLQVHSMFPCRHSPSLVEKCVLRIRWFGEVEGGSWWRNIDAVAHEVYNVKQPTGTGRRFPLPHALQRGHLLVQEKDGALRAHAIERSNMSSLRICDHWDSKRLVEIDGAESEEEPADAERCQFVPVHGRGLAGNSSVVGRVPLQQRDVISTFAYVPTVSPAPLTLYFGTPLKDLQKF